mgnify:CR=1 FL=1
MKFIKSALVSLIIAACSFSNVANAGLIDFEGVAGTQQYDYISVSNSALDLGDGFFLSNQTASTFGTFIIGSNYNSSWGNAVSSGIHGLGFYNTISVIDKGGDIFDALSINAGSVYDNNTSIRIEGFLSGVLTNTFTTGNYNVFESSNVALNFVGIDSIKFSLVGGSSALIDDLVTSSVQVPEPSTLAIFALGMIGLASRRFKKQ